MAVRGHSYRGFGVFGQRSRDVSYVKTEKLVAFGMDIQYLDTSNWNADLHCPQLTDQALHDVQPSAGPMVFNICL